MKMNKMCMKMIEAIDEDGNKTVEFEEFCTLMKLQKLFNSFDADGHGTIDKGELRMMMEAMGWDIAEKRAGALVCRWAWAGPAWRCGAIAR